MFKRKPCPCFTVVFELGADEAEGPQAESGNLAKSGDEGTRTGAEEKSISSYFTSTSGTSLSDDPFASLAQTQLEKPQQDEMFQ